MNADVLKLPFTYPGVTDTKKLPIPPIPNKTTDGNEQPQSIVLAK